MNAHERRLRANFWRAYAATIIGLLVVLWLIWGQR